jgi:hypothetical protein
VNQAYRSKKITKANKHIHASSTQFKKENITNTIEVALWWLLPATTHPKSEHCLDF